MDGLNHPSIYPSIDSLVPLQCFDTTVQELLFNSYSKLSSSAIFFQVEWGFPSAEIGD